MEAETLHRELALLSNSLFEFADEDVAGRKPVVAKILDLREQWKDKRYELETGKARRVEATVKPIDPKQGLRVAELKVELAKVRTNVSKYEKKILSDPANQRISSWEAELNRLKGLKIAYETEKILLENETA